MAKKIDGSQDTLKRRLAGGLFRYTFMISIAFHFGIWGIAEMPKDVLGKKGNVKMGGGKLDVNVVKKAKYEDLPPPPSIERTEPAQAPKGLEAKGSVGEVPLPVPDELAEADTISDAVGAGEGTGFGEGTEIIVEENVQVEETGGENPWDKVTIIEYSEPPVIVYEQRPTYPDIARDSKVEGDVVLLVYIDTAGNVRNAIVQSSPGLPALEEAARTAAMKCKFKPAKQQGVPVGVWYSIVMQFRL